MQMMPVPDLRRQLRRSASSRDEESGSSVASEQAFGMPEIFQKRTQPVIVAPNEARFPVNSLAFLEKCTTVLRVMGRTNYMPIMGVVAHHRISVQVMRHTGDYTFVTAQGVPDYEMVGFTVHRALLRDQPPPPPAQQQPSVSVRVGPARGPASHVLGASIDDPDAPMSAPSSKHARRTRTGLSQASDDVAGNDRQSNGATLPRTDGAREMQSLGVLMHSGNELYDDGQLEAAITTYTEALPLARNPAKRARVLSNRSAVYLRSRNVEAALADAQEVLRLDPSSTNGLVRVANCYHGMRDYATAKTYYERAIAADPRTPIVRVLARNNLLQLHLQRRNLRDLPVRIVYNRITDYAELVPRRPAPKDMTVLEEAAAPLVMPIWQRAGAGTGASAAPTLCDYCGAVLSFSYSAAEADGTPEPCAAGCGAKYCGRECQQRGHAAYHCYECRAQGSWGPSLGRVDTYLASSLERCAARAESPAEVERWCLVISKTLLAVRMLAVMCTAAARPDGASTEEGEDEPPPDTDRFAWLPTASSVRGRALPAAEKEMLVNVHFALSQSFSPAQDRALTTEVLMECYCKVASNKVPLRARRQSRFDCSVPRPPPLASAGDSTTDVDIPTPSVSVVGYPRRPPLAGRQLSNSGSVNPDASAPEERHDLIAVFELASLTTVANLGPISPLSRNATAVVAATGRPVIALRTTTIVDTKASIRTMTLSS